MVFLRGVAPSKITNTSHLPGCTHPQKEAASSEPTINFQARAMFLSFKEWIYQGSIAIEVVDEDGEKNIWTNQG